MSPRFAEQVAGAGAGEQVTEAGAEELGAVGLTSGAVGSEELVRQVAELVERPWPLPIVQAGDPVLRRPTEPLTGQLPQDLLDRLIEAMFATMRDAPGVGLAAPQIGLSLALAVVEDDGDEDEQEPGTAERFALEPRALFNPRYEALGAERTFFYEGCLSIAGWYAKIERPRAIVLTTTSPQGETRREELVGWPARIVQHETDHLNGVLFTDHADMQTLSSAENLARFALG